MKPVSTVTAHMETVTIPRVARNEVDYEGELAVIIGRECKDVTAVEVGAQQYCRRKPHTAHTPTPLRPGHGLHSGLHHCQ